MGNNEFARFLAIASGSASELDYELLLAKDLGYLNAEASLFLSGHLSRLHKRLTALLQKVNRERS